MEQTKQQYYRGKSPYSTYSHNFFSSSSPAMKTPLVDPPFFSTLLRIHWQIHHLWPVLVNNLSLPDPTLYNSTHLFKCVYFNM